MPGTVYLVGIDLQVKGDLGVGKLTPSVSRLGSALGGTVSRFSAGMDGGISRLTSGLRSVAGTVLSIGSTIAGWAGVGAGAGIVGLAGWTVHLNDQLEKTKISLGAIFAAQGFASNLQGGLVMANDQIGKMRKDAAALPGEFEDLVGIFQAISIPGGQAGMSVDAIRGLASKVMAAGAVSNLPMDQVAREAAMLMSGRSGAHNVLGMRLMGLSGDSAEKFNKMSADKRVALMTKELDKYAPSIEKFSSSFEGVSSTFKDNVKTWALAAGAPLFERLKETFAEANAWFDQNKGTVSEWGSHIGFELRRAFDIGREKIELWWPAVKAFGENTYSRLVEIWTTIQPYVDRFGTALRDALKDPGTLDKLIELGKIWLAVKGGVMIGQGLGGLADMMGKGGPGAGVFSGGMKLAGKAAGAIGEEIAITKEAASLVGWGEALTTVAANLGVLGLAATALAGTLYMVYDAATSDVDAIADQYQKLRETDPAFEKFTKDLRDGSDLWTNLIDDQGSAMAQFTLAAENAAARLDRVANGPGGINPEVNDYFLALAKQGPGTAEAQSRDVVARLNKHPGGGGGTHIKKVEIVVTGNPEPSRVARLVKDELANLSRRPKVSPDVANYSRPAGT